MATFLLLFKFTTSFDFQLYRSVDFFFRFYEVFQIFLLFFKVFVIFLHVFYLFLRVVVAHKTTDNTCKLRQRDEKRDKQTDEMELYIGLISKKISAH